MHDLRRKLKPGRKSNRGHAKPKNFAPKQQDDRADERAKDWD